MQYVELAHCGWGAHFLVGPRIIYLFFSIPNMRHHLGSLGTWAEIQFKKKKKKEVGRSGERNRHSLQLPGRWQSQRLETLGERTGTKGTRIVLGHTVSSFMGSWREFTGQRAPKALQWSNGGAAAGHPAKHSIGKVYLQTELPASPLGTTLNLSVAVAYYIAEYMRIHLHPCPNTCTFLNARKLRKPRKW